MEQVEVEILGQVITARYGVLKTGDILRTDADFAKHLVDDCSAAKYTQATTAKAEAVTAPAPTRTKRRTPAEMAEAASAKTAEAADVVAAAAVNEPAEPAEPAAVDSSAADAGKSAELPL